MKIIYLTISLVILMTSSAFADCSSAKSRAEKKAANINAQMHGASACKSSKLTMLILEANIEYFNECPEADPGGDIRSAVENSMRSTQNAINSICN